MARSDRYSSLAKTPIYYSDFLNSFDVNPETGNLYQLTNVMAVKQSVKNLVLTDKFERFYQPSVGSKIQSLLFDLNGVATQQLLISTIVETIQNFEKRALHPTAKIDNVESLHSDTNEIDITVQFTLANVPEPIFLPLTLKRIR
jgi:phage baseplate assembly protein W